MSHIHTGVTSRSFLKLAALAGYVILMMTSLLGAPSLRAQSTPAPTATTVASNLTVSPAKMDLGFQAVLPPDGAISNPRNITLSVAKNQPQPVTIEQPLMVSDSTVPPAQFIVQANSCTVIAPGTSCTVPIVFQPNGARLRRAVLLVTSNASNGVQSVNLIGHGKQGVLNINPRSLSFPVSLVGGPTTASKSVTLSNPNQIQLTIHSVTSTNPAAFPIINGCVGVLAPGAKCTVSAAFMAQRNGGINGKIIVGDNATGANTVTLSGGGRGGPTVTPTPTPTRTATPSPTKVPGPFPMRAFPVI